MSSVLKHIKHAKESSCYFSVWVVVCVQAEDFALLVVSILKDIL